MKESADMLASQTGAQIKIIIFNLGRKKKDTFHTKNMIVEPNEPGEVQNQEGQETKVLPANHSPCKSLNLPIVNF